MRREISLTRVRSRGGLSAARTHRSGFTFMEIMLVVVIIGVLLALVGPSLVGRGEEARTTATRQQMKSIQAALTMYEIRLGMFPTTEQGLEALVRCPSDVDKEMWGDRSFMDRVPRDAWKRKFVYKSPGEHNADYDLLSLGRDGQEGTEDDIVSWVQEGEDDL